MASTSIIRRRCKGSRLKRDEFNEIVYSEIKCEIILWYIDIFHVIILI